MGWYWTEKEVIYLMDSWGNVSMKYIAKKLGRSLYSVQLKAQRLGLGAFLEAGDYITLNKLIEEMFGSGDGRSYTVNQWLKKGLPVKSQKVNRFSFKILHLLDWWDWAENNCTLIDFSKLEVNALGKEPDWLPIKRKADIEKNSHFKKTPWTNHEDNLLIQLLNTYKYTYRELSLRLQRTEGAIKRRMCDLGIKARPLKAGNHTFWLEDEVKKLIELYHKGYSSHIIANYISRSSQAISGKIERLIKEGTLFPRSEFRKSC